MTEFNTKLENKFAFWYRIADDLLTHKQSNKNEYENTVKQIAEFDDVETFWKIFQHMKKPDDLKAGIEFQLFRSPIKPLWEDDQNKNGGKISIKLKKESSSLVWEEIVLDIIGGTLPKQAKEEINGIILSIRRDYNFLQIWFKTHSQPIIDDLVKVLREVLEIPDNVDLDIKRFYKDEREYRKEYNPKGKYHEKPSNK